MGCHFLLQGIFPTQGSNSGLLHCRQTLYRLSLQGSLYFAPIPCTLKSISSEFCFYNCKKKQKQQPHSSYEIGHPVTPPLVLQRTSSDPFLAWFARPSLRLSHSQITFSGGAAALTSSSSILEFKDSSLSGVSHKK